MIRFHISIAVTARYSFSSRFPFSFRSRQQAAGISVNGHSRIWTAWSTVLDAFSPVDDMFGSIITYRVVDRTSSAHHVIIVHRWRHRMSRPMGLSRDCCLPNDARVLAVEDVIRWSAADSRWRLLLLLLLLRSEVMCWQDNLSQLQSATMQIHIQY